MTGGGTRRDGAFMRGSREQVAYSVAVELPPLLSSLLLYAVIFSR